MQPVAHDGTVGDVNQHYDPNDGWRPPPRRGPRPQQSSLSIALEALGGGFVIALIIYGVLHVLGLR